MATSVFRMGSRSLEQDAASLGDFANKFLQRKQETQPSPPVSPLLLQPPEVRLTSTGIVSTSPDEPAPIKREPPLLPSEIVTICRNGRPAEYRMYGGFIRFLDE
jgi:hypothetical protein